MTAVFTGLRASELRGLTWDGVDLENDEELTVRQRADRWNEIGSPKSAAGKRTVPLVEMVVNALREWRLACPKGRADLVFPNSAGNVESLLNIHRRGLGPLQYAAGITNVAMIREQQPELSERAAAALARRHPKYGLHSLRHFFASWAIQQGFSAKRIQALMGHSSIQVTFDTYGHLLPNPADDREAMRRLQAKLVGLSA